MPVKNHAEGAIGNFKMGLIAFCGYVVGGVLGIIVPAVLSSPFNIAEFVPGFLLFGMAMILGGFVCLFVVSYFLLPWLLRKRIANDRKVAWYYFALIEVHGLLVLLFFQAQRADIADVFVPIFCGVTIVNLILLGTFLHRPHLHRPTGILSDTSLNVFD